MHSFFVLVLIFFFNFSHAQLSDFNSKDFTVADNTAKLLEGEELNNLPVLSYKLTNKLTTDVEKIRAIFYWVSNNIIADDFQNTKIIKTRKKLQNDSIAYIAWNNQYKKKMFKNLIKNKKTICTGYAYLIKELSFFANIECEIINGYGRTIEENVESLNLTNHSWNAIKLNNKWYLCDATWASGYLDSNGNFIKEFNDGYFLTNPNLFAINHIPIDKKWFIDKDIYSSKNELPPLVYGETFKIKIQPIFPKKMIVNSKVNEEITFSFKKLSEIDTAQISLVHFFGAKEIPLKIYNINNDINITSFKYVFKRKGSYDIHLKINNEIVASYIIKISKY